ncbi:interferon-induced protein 44 isoform X2 [Perca flavescens]|uniref:interferon-induced protein 44 isoform X2 n=1 Tax=Perca flavescens TaxID=8167 RepID=UPI00106E38B9|nr:interferon-induced protein 44-like isoform X2 [Perca flavescens]
MAESKAYCPRKGSKDEPPDLSDLNLDDSEKTGSERTSGNISAAVDHMSVQPPQPQQPQPQPQQPLWPQPSHPSPRKGSKDEPPDLNLDDSEKTGSERTSGNISAAVDHMSGTPTSLPSPTLKDPWRKIPLGDKEKDLQYVQDYEPGNDDLKHLRILLYGPVGAGKSSFINSVSSTLQGRMTIPALTSATTSDRSFTTRYATHKIRKEGRGKSKSYYPFVFNDVMGLEKGDGVRPDDIKLALKGHVKEGYKFNPVSPLSAEDPWYNPCPSPEDKVHVLVCVLSANTAEITDSVLKKMAEVRKLASDLGIPQMAIGTNIDSACPETEKDLKNVYKSKHIKQKVHDFSASVGIPVNCIFPVKNYYDEIKINDDVDSLILSALRQMIDFGDDFIDK